MGKFHYNATTRTDVDDRLLLHLQIVMGTKLRRGEPFAFTWKHDSGIDAGRTMVWISASTPLVFDFSGSRQPAVNQAWLELLMRAANSPGGLYAVREPELVASKASDDLDEGALQPIG